MNHTTVRTHYCGLTDAEITPQTFNHKCAEHLTIGWPVDAVTIVGIFRVSVLRTNGSLETAIEFASQLPSAAATAGSVDQVTRGKMTVNPFPANSRDQVSSEFVGRVISNPSTVCGLSRLNLPSCLFDTKPAK